MPEHARPDAATSRHTPAETDHAHGAAGSSWSSGAGAADPETIRRAIARVEQSPGPAERNTALGGKAAPMSAGPAVIQRSSQAALIAWSQAQAATAAYEVIGTKSDFAILRLRGQQVGGAQVTLEFHIHVPNGEVERAYAGALYEADNRDDGELKSHDEASVNRIVSRWKDAMAALGTTTFETQEVKAANARRAEEAEAAETLRAEQAEGARLAEAVPVADESTEEFVRRLLTGQAEGLITFEIRTLDKAAAEDLPAKKALLQEYWLGHNARKQQEAEGATGKW